MIEFNLPYKLNELDLAQANLNNSDYAQDVVASIDNINDMIRWVSSYFNRSDISYGHGYINAIEEASELVYTAIELDVNSHDEKLGKCRLTNSEKIKILGWVFARVHQYLPLAYITNHIYYYGYSYYVDQRTIIPRSPIGELINNGFVGLLNAYPKNILDLCTGSGVLALFAAQKFTNAQVDGVDISVDALDVAHINLENYSELQDRVAFIESDLFSALGTEQLYDLIISNPPYVDCIDLETMPEEYSHEPELALGAGVDGLDILRKIFANILNYLAPQGVFICEVGNSQEHLKEKLAFELEWIKFENGGDGVFKVTREELLANQEALNNFCNS